MLMGSVTKSILLLLILIFLLNPITVLRTLHLEQVTTANSKPEVLPRTVIFDLPSPEMIKDDNNPLLNGMLNQLIALADSFLSKKPASVMDKEKLPPSGDKHDFLSLAPFWWPDHTKKDLLPYLYRDGKLNPEVHLVPDRNNIHDLIHRTKILSVAYHFTNNISYASKATELLQVWFINNDTRMNPNLQYSEVISGKNNGSASGIITTSFFSEILDSIQLVQNSSAWSMQDQKEIEEWFEKYLEWLLNSEYGKREQKRLNNHGTWFDFQVSSIALSLNKTEIAIDILERNIEKTIETKIDQDGSQPYEIERSNSLGYHIYNLQAFFNLAKVGDNLGIDLWHHELSDGSGLKRAIDYLLPYVLEKQQWPYQQEVPIRSYRLADLLCQASKNYEPNTIYREAYKSIAWDNGTYAPNSLIYGCLNLSDGIKAQR
jgi:hypothetical protein